jgi:hypothetical protein
VLVQPLPRRQALQVVRPSQSVLRHRLTLSRTKLASIASCSFSVTGTGSRRFADSLNTMGFQSPRQSERAPQMELATDLSKTALARPRGSWKGPHRVTEYTGTILFQATRRIQVPVVASSRAWHFSTGKRFRRNAESPIAGQHF